MAYCGVPGRLVNWISRLEDEKITGCLPFWHQANNLNDLAAGANEGNGAWWLYQWYGNMSGKTQPVSSTTSYDKLYGVSTMDEAKRISTTLLGGYTGSIDVKLNNVTKTQTFQNAEYVNVTVQETAFSGFHGAANDTPVILKGVYPVAKDGSVTVTDFGIACLSNSANTMTQEALGSVHYISPEQAKGNRPDARSDIYSAGVVLYEMLTGRLPFEGDSAVSVAIQHLSSVPLSPREIDPDVPEALEKICMKAMASDIDRRYPTADAMLADLEEFRKNPDVDLDFSIEDLRRPDTDEPTQYIPAVQAVTPKREEPQEDEPVDEKKTQKMLLLAGGIALAAVIVFALWNVIMGSFRKEPVQTEFTVPNLFGMTIEEAEADERVKGIFTITEMGSRASSEYAEGQIVEQTPAADNVVRSNREIQVFVSTGEKTEPMPSVTGLEWRNAKIILDDLGLDLQYNWKDEYSDSITSGCVIRTEPAKGEMLRQGDVLLLYRSKGPEPKPVTVISFLTYEQTTAVEEAETLGLKVTVKHVYSDALAGTVVEQSIAQDTVVTTGAEIVLTVSDGPDPSVSGTEGIPPEAA